MKLHLPKQLFTALLAALTLTATPAAWGVNDLGINRAGNFWAADYAFSFILNDDAFANGNTVVLGKYYGSDSGGQGANAIVAIKNGDSISLQIGQGGGANFAFYNNGANSQTFTGLQTGVVYTLDVTGASGAMAPKLYTIAAGTETATGTYNGNMNGYASISSEFNSSVATLVSASGADGNVANSNILVWAGAAAEGATSASWGTWNSINGTTIGATADADSILYFDTTSEVAKTVDISGSISVASIKVYDNYTFNATAATTLSTTEGLSIASGKTLTLEDNVTLSISSTIRGAGTLALEGGTLHIADCSTLDDLAYTFSDNADGFRTGFSATLTEGTISTSADALNITIEGAAYESYADGRLTATLNKEDIFYINTSRNYNAIKTSATGATGIIVSSTGTLNIASTDTNWFVEGTVNAVTSITNEGNIVLDCSVTEGDPKSVSLNSLFGDSAITQTSAGTTTISDAKAVSTSSNLSTGGTVKISGAESFANNGNTLTLDKLVLENVTEATINGTGSGTGKVSGTIEVLGKSKLILTGSHDLLGWGTTAGNGDYTDKILLRGTDADNLATLQLNNRQTCSTDIVMEGYSTILNGGNPAVQNNATDNAAGILQMHDGGSITATGTDNTFSAILYTSKATSIAVTNTGDTLLIDGVVRGGSAITKTGDGTLTFSGNMAWQDGTINVNDGIVVLDDAATLGSSAYVVANGAELQVSGVTRETFSNAVRGDGTLTKTGAGTLTMDGNLSVSNVKATGGTLKLTGTLGSGTYTATGGNITLGSMTVNSGVQLNLASTNGHYINAESGSVITNNGTIDLSGVHIAGNTRGDTAFCEQTRQFISLISSISGGNVKLHTGNFTFQMGNESNQGPAEVVFNAAYSNGGTLRLANYKKTTQWKVGSNASLTVSGQLWLDHKQELNIDGGQVIATSMKLGYDTGQHGSIINLSSGSLTTGTITLAGDDGNNHKTAINMSGGELTFTNSTTLEGSGKVDISITGGTLKATTSDWTLTGSDTHVVSLGNAAIDIAAGKTVTLAGAYDLTDTLTLTGNTVTENETTTTGTLVLGGTMNVTGTELLERGDGTYSGADSNVNGFFTGNYYLVKNTDNAAITTTGLSVTLGGEAVASENVSLSETGNHLLLTGGSNGIFYVNSGEEVAKNSTVNTAGYVRHHVESKGVLVITPEENTLSTTNAQNALLATTGSGTISLNGDLTIVAGSVSKATGSLVIREGATLTMDNGNKADEYDLSSFTSVKLLGGTIKYHGAATTLNNVTVDTAAATLSIEDMKGDDGPCETFTLAGTTTLNNALNIKSTNWKYQISIEKLIGEGDLSFSSSSTQNEKASVIIESLDSTYSGTLTSVKNNGSAELTLNNLRGTYTNTKIKLGEGAAAFLSVNQSETATLGGAISGDGSITKQGAGKLTLSGASSYTGTTTVSAGELALAAGASLGSGAVTVASGASLSLGDNATLSLSSGTSSLGTLTAGTGSKINLDTNATLNQFTKSGTGTVTLAGSGLYELQDGAITMTSGVSLSDNWTGTVKMSNVAYDGSSPDNNKMETMASTAGSGKLMLTNVNGWLGTGTMSKHLILENGSGGEAALYLSNGSSADNSTKAAIFSGGISGTGDIQFNWNKTGVTNCTLAHTISGDTASWSGKFISNESGSLDVRVDFTKGGEVFSSTVDGGGVENRTDNKLTVNVGSSDADTSFNGSIGKTSGAGAVELNVTHNNVTFNKAVNVDKLTVAQGASAQLGNTMTVDSVSFSAGESATAETPAKLTGKSTSALAQLAEEASFTIEDMTLTNTTVTAATVETKVKLQNVEGSTALLAKGAFTLHAAPTVGMAPTAESHGTLSYTNGLAIATDANASLTLNLDVVNAVAGDAHGTYDLTITLSGFGEGFTVTEGILDMVGFDSTSWLGQALVSQKAEYTVVTEQTPATAGEGGVPTVSYAAGTGANVGSLVITISGLNVPEPASATLGLASLMMLCARRRRKA